MKTIVKNILLTNILLGLVACGGSSNNLDLEPAPDPNIIPISNAGADQNIVTGTIATLDGTLSFDANGDRLTYEWLLTTIPSGSAAGLSSLTTVTPSFTADLDGTYIAQLFVNDGIETSTVNQVHIVASTGNSIPVASAGADQNIVTGQKTQLNGSSSSDANGDTLSYEWTLNSVPTGSSATLSNSTSVSPTFISDVDGSYVVQLTVNDGLETSAIDNVTIFAFAPTENSAPMANAGTDQNKVTGTVVTLDGSLSSDANGDTLSYQWSLTSVPSGSEAELSNSLSVSPMFTTDVDGTYVVQLYVSDGTKVSAIDTVKIVAVTATGNSAPVANAGADQNIETGAVATLNGSLSSDANGDTLSYNWSLISSPSGSAAVLINASSVTPKFSADVDGSYVVKLTVSDGTETSAVDTVSIVAVAGNLAPIAHAGVDQNIVTGEQVTLNGSSSTDVNGDPLTYQWSFTSVPSGSSATLSNSFSVSPTFNADVNGSYIAQLTVSDGVETSSVDTVIIVAATENSTPIADAGIDQNIVTGTLVTLDGLASSDADDDTLTYAWTLVSVPSGSITASLSSSNSVSPTFIPDVDGSYVAQLTVNDGVETSLGDSVIIVAATVNSAPVANAGINQNVITGENVILNGALSTDVNGDPLTYQWSLISVPSGSSASLNNSTSVATTFNADLDGSYVAQLTVNDGVETSTVDTVVIVAETVNTGPIANAGIDQNTVIGALVTLNGLASSDADGDTLTYAWTIVSVPSGSITASLSSTIGISPTFIADVAGAYVVQLTVNDGEESSAVDNVTITAALGI